MKWIFRLATFSLLVGAIAWPFFMKNRGGEPMLSIPTLTDWQPPALKDFIPGAGESGGVKSPLSGGTQVFYKWRDEHGQLHYSDEPPPQTAEFQIVEVDPNANVIQSVPVDEEEEATPEPAKALPGDVSEILTPGNARKVLEDAKVARKMMESRTENIDQALEKNTR